MAASETLAIEAENREASKSENAKLRKNKKIPAVIYSKNMKENITLAINENDIMNEYLAAKFLQKLVHIKVGSKTHKVVVKSIDLNPVSDAIEHIDFLDVSQEKTVTVDVRVTIKGRDRSPGIKRGGYINYVKRFVKIQCAPESIPNTIEIDISAVQIGEAVKVKNVNLPEKIKHAFKEDQVILSIIGKGGKAEDEAEAEAEATTKSGSEAK